MGGVLFPHFHNDAGIAGRGPHQPQDVLASLFFADGLHHMFPLLPDRRGSPLNVPRLATSSVCTAIFGKLPTWREIGRHFTPDHEGRDVRVSIGAGVRASVAAIRNA